MDYKSLICSFSLFGAAFAFYKIHKLWHKDVTENDKLYKFQIKFDNFKHWVVIIMFIIMGIVYFFKATGQNSAQIRIACSSFTLV